MERNPEIERNPRKLKEVLDEACQSVKDNQKRVQVP